MIIYECQDSFLMISQHEHARISGEISEHLKEDFFYGMDRKKDVILGIYEHDRGWIQPDESPLWNENKKRPYSFIDYPIDLKVAYYKKGIDEVEQKNLYAGLLCSIHYSLFFINDRTPEGKQYLLDEKKRQRFLLKELGLSENFEDETIVMRHLTMLRFCDNLSLFISLNKPGVNEHPFFRDGIPQTFPFAGNQPIHTKWVDAETVCLSIFPFQKELQVELHLKEVDKAEIKRTGLSDAYKNTPFSIRQVTFI